MKNYKILTGLIFLTLMAGACKKSTSALPPDTADPSAQVRRQTDAVSPMAYYTTSNWLPGTLPASGNPSQLIVPNASLLPLNVSLSGSAVFKSNNPEIFTGNGWLMQNSHTDPGRGGSSYPLTGTNIVYLFHINQSGATKYIHLIVTNPNASSITVSSKGSYYTNAEKPLTGAGTGQSYYVAKDWLNNTLRQPQTSPVSINQGKATEVFNIAVNSSGMVDGRFEVTTSGNAYYYTVITDTKTLSDAVNVSQGGFAPGSYYTESANAYGREAGIYAASNVAAENDLDIPNSPSHAGFDLNTTNKFYSSLEDQTASALMTMSGASSKTYGNYGHHYSVLFHLHNNNTVNKTVKLYFASNSIDSTKSNATWNGQVKMNGSFFTVYTQLNAPRQQLSSWNIPPGLFNVTLEFYVPGLITANQQLIFEVQ
jgi:hypothetical protein